MPQIAFSDLSLHYQESGVGTPVILIHGHPFDCTSWTPQLIASFPGYRLIAADLRNFGRTTSPNPPAGFSTSARALIAPAPALALHEFFLAGLSHGEGAG